MSFRKMLVKIKEKIYREEGYLTEIEKMLENLFFPKLEKFTAEDLYRPIDIEYHQVSKCFFFYIDGEPVCTYCMEENVTKKLNPFDTLVYVLTREGLCEFSTEGITDKGDSKISFNLFFGV